MKRLLVFVLATLPALAAAQATDTYVLVAPEYTVTNRAGTQTDPHLSGNLVAYTDESFAPPQVRVHTLGGSEVIIPDGRFSDISGTRIVFTRGSPPTSSIYLGEYDASTGLVQITELNSIGGSMRDQPAIGGGTVAWVEYGLAQETEIVAYDIATQQATRLTVDQYADREPAVAPSGNVIVWTRCLTGGTEQCDIVRAERDASGGWTTPTVMAVDGEESLPATDGAIVAYQSVRNNAPSDIWYRPISGGPEVQVPLTEGVQQNASVAGGLIAFESKPDASTSFDIYLYDTATGRRYQLTFSSSDERLSDIDVDPATGEITVVYVRNENGDENIYALRLKLDAPPQDSCESPGDRDVLTTLTLTREKDSANAASVTFDSTEGTGLLCVRNGYPKKSAATTGKVSLNGVTRFGSSDFQKKAAWLEANVQLQDGENVLSASIGGDTGTTYTVTVYGPLKSGSTAGCSSTTASVSLLALLAVVSLVLRSGRRQPALARRGDRR